MNKKYYSKFKIKDMVLRRELARAHGMIVLLVIALMTTLIVASSVDVQFTKGLTAIAVVLLAFVGIISLTVILSLLAGRKK